MPTSEGPRRQQDDLLAGARGLRGMRPEIERVLADVAAMEQRAEALPHRRANLALNNWFGRHWCELLLAWLHEAERVLGPGTDG